MVAEIGPRPMNVLAQHVARIFDVASNSALRDLAVLLGDVSISRRPGEEHAPVAVVEIEQQIAEMKQQRLLASRDQRDVELAMHGLPLLQSLGPRGVALGSVETVQGPHDIAFPFDVAETHRLLKCEDFQFLAQGSDLLEIG